MDKAFLATATVGRTHGVEGFLRLVSLSGETAHLRRLSSCVLVTRDKKEVEVEIESIRSLSDSLLVRFQGYETLEKARFLSGSVMYIDRKFAPKLKKGEVYVADLFGLDVIYDGKVVGKVSFVSDGAQAMFLNVKKTDGEMRVVPYLPVYVGRPDLEKGSIELLFGELLD
ncbi:MAG: ribosome maturation factor RimM [Sphaerochaetaceae bacterium]|nr:ribosome maturation factor RimM [Sphaerochaetaceae bacterium]